MPVMARKKSDASKKPKRSGRPVQIYVDEDLWDAMTRFFGAQKFKPTLTDFGVLAFQELLKREGFWPPSIESEK
jgi:hypothetical protein